MRFELLCVTADQLRGALKAQGQGDLDHTALFGLIEQLSGRYPPSDPTRPAGH